MWPELETNFSEGRRKHISGKIRYIFPNQELGTPWVESCELKVLSNYSPIPSSLYTELNWFKLGHFSLMIENQGAVSYLLFTWQIYTNESIATSKGNMRIQFWDQLNLALYQMNKCSADKKTKYYGHNLSKITTQFLSTKCIW